MKALTMEKLASSGPEFEAALKDLQDRIKNGEEYPDATWRATSKRSVDLEALDAAYMDACAREQERPRL